MANATGSAERDSPAKVLRRIINSPGVHQGPACFDALSAKLIEKAGFDYCITSGNFIFFFIDLMRKQDMGFVLLD